MEYCLEGKKRKLNKKTTKEEKKEIEKWKRERNSYYKSPLFNFVDESILTEKEKHKENLVKYLHNSPTGIFITNLFKTL